MSKLFYITILSFTICNNAYTQDTSHFRHYISIGAGFPNLPRFFFDYLDYKDQFSSKGTGPLHFKYEYRLSPRIGLGLSVNHLTYTISYKENVFDTATGKFVSNNVKISNNNTAANFRVNFHFIKPSDKNKLDVYAGIGAGYQFGKLMIDSDYPEYQPSISLPGYSKIAFEISAGARYFFDKQIGVYLEAGLTKSIVQAGVTARF